MLNFEQDEKNPNQGLLANNGGINPLLALGIGMLAASGPSPKPVGFGQALAAGLQSMQQMGQQQFENQYKQTQLEQLKQEMAIKQKEMANKELLTSKTLGLLNGPQELPDFTGPRTMPQLAQEQAAASNPFANLDPQTKATAELALLAGDFKGFTDILKPSQTNLQKNLAAAGLKPGTPEYNNALLASVTKPGVSISTGSSYNIPPGYMLKDPSNPAVGLTPIPGSDKDESTPEQAGKIQMQRSAKDQLGLVKDYVFDKDGTPDRTNIANAQSVLGISGTPFTKGRTLRSAIEQGIQAITRLETGAAMPPSEVENTRERFMPKPFDSDELVNLKYKMFDDFINGSLKLIDPSGRFDAERFETEMQKRMKGTNTGGLIEQTSKNPQAEARVRKYNPQTGGLE